MSGPEDRLPAAAAHGAAEDFRAYCAEELLRRRNAAADFDAELHQAAIELVMAKLGVKSGNGEVGR